MEKARKVACEVQGWCAVGQSGSTVSSEASAGSSFGSGDLLLVW